MTTPLQEHLHGPGNGSTTGPLDAFRLGRRLFMVGERLDMQAMAAELGVNRAPL